MPLSESELNVGLDLDEVLAGFLDGFLLYHNAVYGTALERSQFHSYNFEDVWKCTRDEAVQRLRAFERTPLFEDLPLITGADQGVRTLKTTSTLFIITSRHEELAPKTYHWLHRDFRYTFQDVVFTNHYRETNTRRKKSDVCKTLGINVFVDDSHEHAVDCARAGIPVLLLDSPWNQEDHLPERVTRVHSWDEIVERVQNRHY